MPCADSTLQALREIIKPEVNHVIFYIEYLDAERFPLKDREKSLVEYLKDKYRRTPISAILACGREAFLFAKKHAEEILGIRPPLVFCNIDRSFYLRNKDLFKGCSGVLFKVGLPELIRFVRVFFPYIKGFLVVNDGSCQGVFYRRLVEEELSSSKFRVISVGDRGGFEEVAEKISKLPRDFAVIIGHYSTDGNGNYFPPSYVSYRVAHASKGPVFCLFERNLGEGVVGGFFVRGYDQGEAVAKIILKLFNLNGATNSWVMYLKPKAVFDSVALLSFGVKPDRLPRDTVFVNSFNTELTELEREWIKKHPKVRLGVDPDFPPIDFIDQYGEYKGISSEFFKEISKATGLKFELIRTSSWHETLKLAREGVVDVVSAVSYTPERAKYLIYTTPYLSIPVVIATKSSLKREVSLEDLRGKRVGVVREYSVIYYIRKNYPEIRLVEVENIREGINLLLQSRIYALLVNQALLNYYVENYCVSGIKIAGTTPYAYVLSIGVRRDLPILRDIIQKGLNSIGPKTRDKLVGKWTGMKRARRESTMLKEKSFYLFLLALIVTLLMGLKLKRERILSKRDSLTGAYTRAFLKNLRKRKFGSVIFLDLDHFKDVNDKYGHSMGDTILKGVVRVLKENLRKGDAVIRYGGEEFLVLLDADPIDAVKVAEKLRKRIEKEEFAEGVRITASFGVSEIEDDLEKAIEKADRAMYEAKKRGRNRVIAHITQT